ncbi:hypothetical protein SLEP1_g57556 [Rubroshorea leprosula]|uniref:Reverse transcriptase Ty1/copia-type domain-containing protein n=1 Tax=Rubroshorea leprosula TaxID=152421 RepID=A0AAV5MQ68_9ROSI|nr:hypothetical protein SLEP1_g57556 [Rubroshorea leprosula]
MPAINPCKPADGALCFVAEVPHSIEVTRNRMGLPVFPLIQSSQLMHHLEEGALAMTIIKDGKEVLNPDYELLVNNDGLLTSWLLGTMNEEALSLVVGCHTALKCWYRFNHAYQSEELSQALATINLMKDKDPNVCVDTGSLDHMTSDKDSELCKYPDGDEWIHASLHLQPSRQLDDSMLTNPRVPTIIVEKENSSCTNSLIEQSLEASSATSSEATDRNQQIAKLVISTSSSTHVRVDPPPHNATSISHHPMMTRTRTGTHTRHVETIFPKHANIMTNNKSFLNTAELDALHKNEMWKLVPPPSPSTNNVGFKRVFKTELHPDGSLNRFKACLVVKGYSQMPRVDYDETFSPVLKSTTLRLVIALATILAWPFKQLAVNDEFLHGKLKEIVYMTQPPGFEDPKHPNYVCQLNQSIYGLKQAPRAWNLVAKKIDHLMSTFALKDLGTLNYFLSIEVIKFNGRIFLSQAKYATDLLTRTAMLEASIISTPLAVKENTTSRDTKLIDAKEYRKIVDALQYLTITRVDICHAINKEKVVIGTLVTRYISSINQLVDILTKPKPYAQFKLLRFKLGVVASPHYSMRGSIKAKEKSQKFDTSEKGISMSQHIWKQL